MRIESETLNVLQLGAGFLLIFFSSYAQSAILETIIDAKNKDGVVDEHAGYVSAAIVTSVFTFANFIAAPVVGLLGVRWAMVSGAITYIIFQAGFLFLNEPFLYFSSALLGVGAAIIWAAQGKYIAMNSTNETASLHSSLFWGEYQLCLIGSGAFLYFAFRDLKDNDKIEDSKIRFIYGVFTTVTACGVIIFSLLRIPRREEPLIESEVEPEPKLTFKERMFSTLSLLRTRRIIFLAAAFAYVGMETSFWSGIYPSSISFTKKLAPNTKTIMAFNTIAEGLGQATAGFLFGILGGITKKIGRVTVVLLGMIAHFFVFVAVYLNFPSDAPLGKTEEEGIIKPPSVAITIICGYFLGFGDACWNTQIFYFLVSKYSNKVAEAFSLFFFFQCVAASMTFLYATHLQLEGHLLILTTIGILGFIGFFSANKFPTTEEEENGNPSSHVE